MSATKAMLTLYLEAQTATEAEVLAGAEGKLVTADVIAPLLGQAVPDEVVQAAVDHYLDANPGLGDVTGPGSAINGRPALFDGTTGKLLKVGAALGDGATKNVGTTENTLAAGDDDRLVGAVQVDEIGETPLVQFTGGRPGVLSQRFKDWGITPDDFAPSALRDVSANSTEHIMDAIAAVEAGDGGCVRLLPGEYAIEPHDATSGVLLDNISKVSIVGHGRQVSRLRLANGGNVMVVSLKDVSDVTMRGFTIDGNADNQSSSSHGLRGYNLQNVTVRDIEIHDAYSYGIGLQDGVHVNVRLEDLDIYSTGADGIDIKNKDNGVDGCFLTNIRVRNWGIRPDLEAQAAIDLRGYWTCSGIFISAPGANNCQGLRTRFGDSDIENGLGAHDCSISNFRIDMGATTAGVALNIGGRDNKIMNGAIRGGHDGCAVVNARAHLTNVSVAGQSDDGFVFSVGGTQFDGGHDATLVSCRVNGGDSGMNVSADRVRAFGCVFDGTDEAYLVNSPSTEFRAYDSLVRNTVTRSFDFKSGATDLAIIGGDFDKVGLSVATGFVVKDAKGLRPRNPDAWVVLGKSAAPASLTGSTSATTLGTISIPGGSMGPKGRLRIRTLWSHTNSANNKTMNLRLASSTFHSVVQTTQAALGEEVVLVNNNDQAAQVVYGGPGGIGPSTVSNGTYSYNTASTLTLDITGQLANAGETLTLESWAVEVLFGE